MRPRLGFAGLGWIGLDRMKAVVDTASVEAICDPSPEARDRALAVAPAARVVDSLSGMFGLGLDGIVLATPSALHAEQCVAALDAGLAVFCQKPLGRTASEVGAVVEASRRADRRVGVDLSYRHTRALEAVHRLVASGELGSIYGANLVFHNAYGPDKVWYRDRRQSGGGCVTDLGIHLVDAALWVLGFPRVERISGTTWVRGERRAPGDEAVEDHAVAEIHLETGAVLRLACSWWLSAGRDAEIALDFWGTRGAARFRNVDGSFYVFVADRCHGTSSERIASPPDPWGGRGIARWVELLSRDPSFDPELAHQVEVARALDRIVGQEAAPPSIGDDERSEKLYGFRERSGRGGTRSSR